MADVDDRASLDDESRVLAREGVVADIVDAIRARGYYLGELPLHGQASADMHWAAREAGRALDRTVRAFASRVGARVRGTVSVAVVPVCGPGIEDPACTRCGHQIAVELAGNTPSTAARPTYCRRMSLRGAK